MSSAFRKIENQIEIQQYTSSSVCYMHSMFRIFFISFYRRHNSSAAHRPSGHVKHVNPHICQKLETYSSCLHFIFLNLQLNIVVYDKIIIC